MLNTPIQFKPKINTIYPHNNFVEFERWFGENYVNDCGIEREYIDVYWCAFQVNHNYGKDVAAMQQLQAYIDSLPRDKKYFTISQYDDSVGVNWNGLDVLEFNMSKNSGYPIPLLCQDHPYKLEGTKRDIFCSFIGNITHPIRNIILDQKNNYGTYITTNQHNIETYCEILSRSLFSLCPRGYGINSFRIKESMQYGAIPVYISDEFIIPHNIDFNEYGVLIEEKDAHKTYEILSAIPPHEIIKKQDNLSKYYNEYFTYEANLKLIKEHLKKCS